SDPARAVSKSAGQTQTTCASRVDQWTIQNRHRYQPLRITLTVHPVPAPHGERETRRAARLRNRCPDLLTTIQNQHKTRPARRIRSVVVARDAVRQSSRRKRHIALPQTPLESPPPERAKRSPQTSRSLRHIRHAYTLPAVAAHHT